MAKKDMNIRENIDRGPGEKMDPGPMPSPKEPQTSADIKNAHASGLGSMGRNDQEEKPERKDEKETG